jgi:hypothetical protein
MFEMMAKPDWFSDDSVSSQFNSHSVMAGLVPALIMPPAQGRDDDAGE